MTKFFAVIGMGVLISAGPAFAQESAPQPDAKTTKATYLITGLHCPACTATVEASLQKARGVRFIKLDWKTKAARIEFDETVLSAQKAALLIAQTPHMMGGNMHYAGWLALKAPELKDETQGRQVKELLGKLPGVKHVAAYPAQHVVGIAFDAKGDLTSEKLIAALADANIKAQTY